MAASLMCQLAILMTDIELRRQPDPLRKHTFFVSDGEGFHVRFVQIENDPKYAVPYVSDIAAEQREDAVWP